MAVLNKILVHVPLNLCDGFKTKYVTAATNRDTSYDSKIVFLEKTQEIFTKGKLYGTNIGDFNDLKALVGTIPSGATSTNIVDYITEKINSADHIHSVSKKSGETLIDVTTSNKAVTVNSTSALTTAVSNANSAVQSVSVLGKTLNNTTNSLSVDEAKTALGLGSAAFVDKSYFVTEHLINALGGSATSYNGNYVNVTVNTSGGQVSGVTVDELPIFRTAVHSANSAVQSVSVLGKTLNKTTNSLSVDEAKTALGLKSAAFKDETEVFNYVSDNMWENYTA